MSLTGSGPDDPQRVGVPIGDLLAGHVRRVRRAGRAARARAHRARPGRPHLAAGRHSSACTPSRAPAGPWPARWAGPRATTTRRSRRTGCSAAATAPCRSPSAARRCGSGSAPASGSTRRRTGSRRTPSGCRNRERVIAVVEAAFAEWDAEPLLARLAELGVPAGKVRTLDEVYDVGPDALAGAAGRRRPRDLGHGHAARAAAAVLRRRRPATPETDATAADGHTRAAACSTATATIGRRAQRGRGCVVSAAARRPAPRRAPTLLAPRPRRRVVPAWDGHRSTWRPGRRVRRRPRGAREKSGRRRGGRSPARACCAAAGSRSSRASSPSSAGSIGVAAAERLVLAIERATAERLPLLAAPVSGGTRMQEGTVAFLQMVKISAAIAAHKAAGLPYLVYLRHPTTGGVLASWGSLGHVTVAEPGALIGFLGPRVYEALYGQPFPEGVQVGREPLRQGPRRRRPAARAGRRRPRPRAQRADGAARGAARAPPSRGATRTRAGRPGVGVGAGVAPRPDRPGVRRLLRYAARMCCRSTAPARASTTRGCCSPSARFGGAPCVVLGQDRRGQTETDADGTGGAARGAPRACGWPAELRLPLVTVIDTPGAALSKAAEEGGLAGEIARCLAELVTLDAPTVSVLLGQGTGGGALALVPADRVIAAQHAWLSPLPPEGASAIVHRDTDARGGDGAAAGRPLARLARNGIVDRIVPERPDAADEPEAFCRRMGQVLQHELVWLMRARGRAPRGPAGALPPARDLTPRRTASRSGGRDGRDDPAGAVLRTDTRPRRTRCRRGPPATPTAAGRRTRPPGSAGSAAPRTRTPARRRAGPARRGCAGRRCRAPRRPGGRPENPGLA